MRKRFFWEVALINQEKTAVSLLHLKRQDKWLQGYGEITGGTRNHQCGDYKLGFTLFSSAATKQLQMHQPNVAFQFLPHSMLIVMPLANVNIVILVR